MFTKVIEYDSKNNILKASHVILIGKWVTGVYRSPKFNFCLYFRNLLFFLKKIIQQKMFKLYKKGPSYFLI